MKRVSMWQALLRLAVIAVAYGAGWYSHSVGKPKIGGVKTRHVANNEFRLTSPLLDVELPEGVGVNYEPLPFKNRVMELVKMQIKNGQAREIAVYYRDMHDGPWFGINENKEFDPASMMKVPVMIAWLKRAEINPRVFSERLDYNFSDDLRTMQTIKPGRSVEPGLSYTVEELLSLMMNYSDNNATRLLYNSLKPEELQDVMAGMDVENHSHGDVNLVSAHGYSGLFRILYNASYLNRNMSEKALHLLSLQEFPQGISAGVPKGTVVAAKFGEATMGTPGKERQLHEFGLVYHPKHAYILGIMTQGSNLESLATVIRQISQLVYTEVDAGTFSQEDNRR